MTVVLALAVPACSQRDRDTIENIQVTQEDWVPLEPGTPPTDPNLVARVGKVLREGNGPKVDFDDLVQLRLRTGKSSTGLPQSDQDATGWVWIGFDHPERGDFPTENDMLASALLNLKQGSVQTFTKVFRPHYGDTLGHAYQLPFGNRQWFDTYMKKKRQADLGAAFKGGVVYADGRADGEGTTVEILRVCKGMASQRLITLMMNHPITVSQDMFRTHETREPRWTYVREAGWEGRCDDGKTMRYAFGPIRVSRPMEKAGKEESNLDKAPYAWIEKAWETVPVGVRME
jgi:hypothetical protein